MTSLLKWWLISCLTMLGLGVSVYFDVHTHLYNSDVTRLSYLILFIFVVPQYGLEIKHTEYMHKMIMTKQPMLVGS